MEPEAAPRWQRTSLLVIAWVNGVSALVGMVGLTVGGGMGIPRRWLDGSIFTSYFWPGVILGVVVGGVQALALAAQHRGLRLVWGMHAAAGLTMNNDRGRAHTRSVSRNSYVCARAAHSDELSGWCGGRLCEPGRHRAQAAGGFTA